MNLLKEINFDPASPSVFVIKKTNKLKYFSIGLLKDQILKKHQAKFPTTLTVIKGSIEFRLENKKIQLFQHDIFEIPVNELHEVIGLEEKNLFILVQEQ